jgi:hypothetical protein
MIYFAAIESFILHSILFVERSQRPITFKIYFAIDSANSIELEKVESCLNHLLDAKKPLLPHLPI